MRTNFTVVYKLLLILSMTLGFTLVKAQQTSPSTFPTNSNYKFQSVIQAINAVVSDHKVIIKWITNQELNTSHFEVERSFDMDCFSTIGLILDGFLLDSTGKGYRFKDNSAELQDRSIAYYRLKQFDTDGKVRYSKALVVRFQANTDAVMQVSPNPFMEHMTVQFNSAKDGLAQIRINSLTGQTMLYRESVISKGDNNLKIDGLSGLSNGMYVAQLIINGAVIDNRKIIKN